VPQIDLNKLEKKWSPATRIKVAWEQFKAWRNKGAITAEWPSPKSMQQFANIFDEQIRKCGFSQKIQEMIAKPDKDGFMDEMGKVFAAL
jgi:hypothetical protein